MLEQLDTLIGFVVVMSVVSLLVMVVTQIVVDALALRGLQLRRALVDMFETLGVPGRSLSEAVISHQVVSESVFSKLFESLKWWSFSAALRPEELYRLALDISLKGAGAAQTEAIALLKVIHQPPKRRRARLKALHASVSHLEGEALIATREKIVELEDEVATGIENLREWFHTSQERARQRFTTQTRAIAIVAAFVAAFVLQLDVFETLRRISVDKELRDHLVTNSTAFSRQAEEILLASDSGNVRMHADVSKTLEKDFPDLVRQTVNPPRFIQKHEVLDWMQQQLAGMDRTKTSAFLKAYEKEFDRRVEARFNQWRERLGSISEQWSRSSLSLQPHWPTSWTWERSHLCGILATAALLSLGAPFWFNILQSLTNLRPVVARQVEENPDSPGTART